MSSKYNSITSVWAAIPWKTRLLVAAFTVIVNLSCRYPLLHRLVLFVFHLLRSPASTKPINGVVSTDVTVDPSRNLWFRLYTPSSSSSTTTFPLIVYFHGGGFLLGAPDLFLFHDYCTALSANLKAIVISVNYCLAPEYKYPYQYADASEVLKFIDADNFRILPPSTDLSRCFLAGDSAGANIAHHALVRAGNHNFKRLDIIGLLSIQPFFGGEERMESEVRLRRGPILEVTDLDLMWKSFLPHGCNRNHEAVNVTGQGVDKISAAEFPATIIFIGSNDPLQDWQMRYYEWLKAAGKEVKLVEYPNTIHGFYLFKEFPQQALLMIDLLEFIQDQSARTKGC